MRSDFDYPSRACLVLAAAVLKGWDCHDAAELAGLTLATARKRLSYIRNRGGLEQYVSKWRVFIPFVPDPILDYECTPIELPDDAMDYVKAVRKPVSDRLWKDRVIIENFEERNEPCSANAHI